MLKIKNKRKTFFFLFIIFLVLILIFTYLKVSENNVSIKTGNELTAQNPNNTNIDEATVPESLNETFEDLTIPYLRSRQYTGKLLGNPEKLNENGTYTSYLTSYDSDGLRINGLLTIPKGEEPENGWPAIVFVHGYIPPQEYETTKNYVSYVDFLAKNGFVVFKIDLRGHGKSEGEAEGGYYSSGYVIDTLNAYNALLTSDFVNPEKVGLWGHSMAGNVIFRAFVAKKDIKAISIWAGAVYTYSDLAEYRISDNSYRPPSQESESGKKRNLLFEKYGSFDPNNEFWMKVVPTNYLDGLEGAVQINHAVDDPVVSIEYTRNLSSVLLESNLKYEVHEYPTGGHNISGPAFNEAMKNTVDFYKRTLN